jgi:putative transposase
VRLYHRFPISFREIEEMMERGMVVTYETIRQWCRTFGADLPERSAPSPATPGDKWHLDGWDAAGYGGKEPLRAS